MHVGCHLELKGSGGVDLLYCFLVFFLIYAKAETGYGSSLEEAYP